MAKSMSTVSRTSRRRGMAQVEFMIYLPLILVLVLLMWWLFALRSGQISVAIDARNTAWAVRLGQPIPDFRALPRDEPAPVVRVGEKVREPAWWSYESTAELARPVPVLRQLGLDRIPLRVRYAIRDGVPLGPDPAPPDDSEDELQVDEPARVPVVD